MVWEEWYAMIAKCIKKRDISRRQARKCIHETANRYTEIQVKQGADYKKARHTFFVAMKKRFGENL